jgi:hypothetical protein
LCKTFLVDRYDRMTNIRPATDAVKRRPVTRFQNCSHVVVTRHSEDGKNGLIPNICKYLRNYRTVRLRIPQCQSPVWYRKHVPKYSQFFVPCRFPFLIGIRLWVKELKLCHFPSPLVVQTFEHFLSLWITAKFSYKLSCLMQQKAVNCTVSFVSYLTL